MTQAFTGALLILSAALFLWTWTVFSRPQNLDDPLVATAARPLPAAAKATPRDDGLRRRDEVATILARPLFSPTRRPKEDAAAAPAAAPVTALPRMTAIMIDGARRSAIFDGNGKPTVLPEGGHLGPFTIQSIEPQQVTIIGPDGKRIVRTTFSNDPPPMATIPPAPQGFLPPPPPSQIVLPPGMPTPFPPGLSNLGPAR